MTSEGALGRSPRAHLDVAAGGPRRTRLRPPRGWPRCALRTPRSDQHAPQHLSVDRDAGSRSFWYVPPCTSEASSATRSSSSSSSAPSLRSARPPPKCPSCSEPPRSKSRRTAPRAAPRAAGARSSRMSRPGAAVFRPPLRRSRASRVEQAAEAHVIPGILSVALLHRKLDRRQRVLDLVREPLRHLLPSSDPLKVFDASTRLLHLAQHPIENARELGELVGSRERDAYLEVAGGDLVDGVGPDAECAA